MTSIIISSVFFAAAFGILLYAIFRHAKADQRIRTAQEVIEKAKAIPRAFVTVPTFDLENREQIAQLAEVARMNITRAFIVKIREECLAGITQKTPADIGNRLIGRIEAYNEMLIALDGIEQTARMNMIQGSAS